MLNAGKTGDERFAAWRKCILSSRDDVVRLAWNRKLFRAVVVMFRGNRELFARGEHILDFLRDSYAADAAMLVRRELDKQHGVLNLIHLLHDIEKHVHVLTARSQAEEGLTLDEVRRNRRELERDAGEVRDYAERAIAHRTPHSRVDLRLEGIDRAVWVVVRTMRTYHNHIIGSDLPSPTPTAAFNWLARFRVPWLTGEFRELQEDEDLDA